MGLEAFTPEIWSAKMLTRLRKSLVFGNLVNRDYEPDLLQFGDRVKINEVGPVTISSYTKDGTLTYETLTSAQKELIVDQAKSFSFRIDDIDMAQNKPKVMNGAMDEASYGISDAIDQYIAGLYLQAGCIGTATTTGTNATALTVTAGTIIGVFGQIGRLLDEGNAGRNEMRWAAIPPWVHQMLVNAGIGALSATAVPKIMDDTFYTGYLGTAMGFNLFMTNNVSTSSTTNRIMCGTKKAISFAGQIAEIEALKLQTTFGNAVRGLYVYGAKVVQPKALCTAYLIEG